jgi:hypothetical protein
MGLLDDAIREHLELKRQHGGDLEEISRQEREALGAARKAEFAKTEDADEAVGELPEAEAEPESEAAEPEAEPVEEPVAAELEPEPEPAASAPFDVDAVDEPPEPESAKPGYDEDPWLEDERDEVPAGDSLEHPRAPEAEAEKDEEGEDVLEETPDFLQETPEHDRLWFEQRPPRDFDWDK